jgi:ferredoxin-type protein NapH
VSEPERIPGAEAVTVKGRWPAYRWLILRRVSQLSIMGLFLIGPLAGIWIVQGNLNSSLTLDLIPLTDPYVLLQSLAARHLPETTAISGALIVIAFYVLVGGRAYCAWVCPVNIVTDVAHWLRKRLHLRGSAHLSAATRYWLLGASLIASAVTGTIVWELVNPVSMMHRGLIFGMGAAWVVILAVFLFDFMISQRGWCGHLCPVGAFYSVLGKASIVRISAVNRDRCNDCTDCFRVCAEPQVLKLPLYGAEKGAGPIILSPNCTNCGRCIDVCTEDVFRFVTRFNETHKPTSHIAEETQS